MLRTGKALCRTVCASATPVTICCKSVPPRQHGPWMRAQAACNPAICCTEAGRPCEFDIERPRLECEMEPRQGAPGLPVPRLGVVEFGLPCLLVFTPRVDAAGVGKVALAKANTGPVCPLCPFFLTFLFLWNSGVPPEFWNVPFGISVYPRISQMIFI